MGNPYEKCPIFETKHFLLRLIQVEDSEELVKCYSDSKSQELFNADNCTGDFCITTTDNMKECLVAWLKAYEQEAFVRFSIVYKLKNKAVGTIEMFGGDIGVLRIDIASPYEEAPYLREIIAVCIENFYDLFSVNLIATKAIQKAQNRIEVLLEAGFCLSNFKGKEDYYFRPL